MAEAASSSAGASEPETQQFGNVLLAGKDQHREENLGTLRMHSGGFGWKSKKTGHVIAISKSDLRGAEWAKAPPYACMLKLRAKGGFSHTFVGLRSQDRGVVGDYCARVFELDLKDVAFSWKGWNWGEALVEGTSLAFRVEDKAALEIPLAAVSQAIASNRKEAIIELADDDTAAPEDEMVVGIRFHVPAAARDDEADEEELAPAETLVAQIKESGDLEASGTSLATFEDVGLTVPRGRYDIEMFDKFLKLHGKTYDYKVLYTNVASVYVLPKQDNYTMAFVVSLEHPLRQGATMYPHIVMQLPRDATVDLEIALDSAELKRRFDDKLERSESGELVDLLPKVMCAFTKKKVVRPKVGGFNGEKEDKFKSIRCSLKANDGFLYPLDKCFFFVANKPLHIDFERIGSLEFNRVDKAAQAQSARTFDITLYMRDGSSHQFVNLQRSDYKELFAFLQGKQIKIRNLAAANKANADDADDESDGGDEDPYMDRIKRQRASSNGAADGMGADDDDDDDDSEEDADFAPGEESDVDEEYEEGGGGGGSDDERAGSSKKKGKKKAESSGSDSGSDSDSDAPKKKKAKPAAKAKASPKKKPQKKKDKDAPKRGMSAFMLWMNASRASIKEEHPDAKVTDIGRIAGAKWKEMDAEAKAPWDAKAKADKERYEAEMKAYKAKQRASLAADDSDSSEAAAPAKPAAGSDSDSD